MTCKRAPKAHVLSIVSLVITTLAILIALVAPAQLAGGGQPSAKPTVATTPRDTNPSLFLPVVTYDPGGQSFSVAIADLNGDGKPDLVVTNAGLAEGVIGVLLGKGDGTFLPVVTYNSGGDLAYSVAVADVNGDGKPDLLVADCGLIGINVCNHSNGLVGVLLGNGDGTFQPVVTYDSGGSTTVSIAVADVNADGKPDVLVANECDNSSTCAVGSVGVLLGNGDGTFQAATTYDVGYAINSLAIADVNGDGKLDLLVAKGGTSNNVGVLLGNGDGTFQPVVDYDSGGNTALSVVAADVNGDGKPDLLVGNACDMSNNCADGSVGVLLGNGDGTFQPVVNYGSGGSGVWALAVADVNGDGTPDLLDASFFYNTLSVLLGNGDGTFQAVTTYGSGGVGPFSVAVADLNGNGKPDVAVANFCGGNGINCLPGKLGVLLNNTPDTTPPVITLAATPKVLWPPNGRMVPVAISGTITDGGGSGVNPSSAKFAVHDEYHLVQPHGKIALDSAGNYSFTILLQASRKGNDHNGRRYTIRVSAIDNAGNRGVKQTSVTVPHRRPHRKGEDD
jgi:FG-GAP-like repeat